MAEKESLAKQGIKLYKQNAQPPKEALKEIKAGRLRGMTDIKPQWRIQALTEQYGLCGIGWKYDIANFWTNDASDDQVVVSVFIKLFVKVDGEWSDPIPGLGGSMLINKESKGLYTSDEAYKMALTDAISVASKAIGIASNIYLGYSDTKYIEDNSGDKPTLPEDRFQKVIEILRGDDSDKKKSTLDHLDGFKLTASQVKQVNKFK
jgi:hypothetical protein